MTLSMLYNIPFTLSKLLRSSIYPEEELFVECNNNEGENENDGNNNNNDNFREDEEEECEWMDTTEDIGAVNAGYSKVGASIELEEQEDQHEESNSVINLDNAENNCFKGSLSVLPFTLKNMAKRYVNDLEWSIQFQGIHWTLYLHVPFYQKGENTVASVGLKIKSIEDTKHKRKGSKSEIDPLCFEKALLEKHSNYQIKENDSGLYSPNTSPSSRDSFESIHELPTKTFEASWEVRCAKNKKIVASCSPSVYSIEAEEEYLVEFADDEFSFSNQLNSGLIVSLNIKSLSSQ